MLRLPIKANRIGNLTDARYFAAWGVDWLGFCLDPNNPHFMPPPELHAIREWISGPKLVGEFGLQSQNEILEAASLLRLDAIQLDPFAGVPERSSFSNYILIKELVLDAEIASDSLLDELGKFGSHVDFFILDFYRNRLDWETIKEHPALLQSLEKFCRAKPTFLSLRFRSDSTEDLLSTLRPYGLAITGGEEERVGVKSFDELDELMELLSPED